MSRIVTLIGKEWADAFRNRLVLWMLILLPVIMTAIPVVMLVVTGSESIPLESLDLNELPPSVLERPPFDALFALDERAAAQAFFGQQLNLLFLMVPLAIPMTIAAYSIVGEKQTRSLEPLLATPISTPELLAGKMAAAALPGIAGAWLAFAVYVVAVQITVPLAEARAVLLAPQWVFAILVMAPLLTGLATLLALIVSSRVNDPRVAEQFSVIIILPLVGLMIGQLAGIIFFDLGFAVLLAIGLLVLDYALLLLAVRLFKRETILTRWR